MSAAPPPLPPNRNSDGSYIVGKNRPPADHQFRKGVSGNPRGRPKGAKGVRTLTLEVLGTRVPVKMAGVERKMNAAEFALHKLRELTARNNLRAALAILDRWEQTVPDDVGSGGGGSAEAVAAIRPPSETDRAILDFFADEIRRTETGLEGDAARPGAQAEERS